MQKCRGMGVCAVARAISPFPPSFPPFLPSFLLPFLRRRFEQKRGLKQFFRSLCSAAAVVVRGSSSSSSSSSSAAVAGVVAGGVLVRPRSENSTSFPQTVVSKRLEWALGPARAPAASVLLVFTAKLASIAVLFVLAFNARDMRALALTHSSCAVLTFQVRTEGLLTSLLALLLVREWSSCSV
jgi:hypothetical protein